MTLATSLRTAARNLINTFGNTVSVYTYSTATKAENDEGDITVSSWGTAASVKMVDGTNMTQELAQVAQIQESLGADEKIARDDTTLAVNDRITVDSVNFKVQAIKPVRTQDTLVIQIIDVTRVDDILNW